MSQTDVAAASDIDRPNYAHLEAGRRRGTEEQITRIAQALRVPVGAIALMVSEDLIVDVVA